MKYNVWPWHKLPYATDEVTRTSRRQVVERLALLLFAGVVLLACNLQAQYLLMPVWLEDIGRLFYKASFFIVLPFRAIVCLFIPAVDHHWSLAHHVVTCMGTPFFLAGLVRLGLGVRRRFKTRRPATPAADERSLDRRQFLLRSGAGVVGLATGGLGSYASVMAPEAVRVRQYSLSIPDLPTEFEALRIAHISDTHYGPFVAMPYLQRVFELSNSLKPDLVLLTGDHVHYTPESVEPGIRALGKLQARLGVVAVMGNHEHWEGADACRTEFKNVGIPLLDNRNLFLTARGLQTDPVSGHSICVAGVGDLWEDEVSFDKALAGAPDDMPRLLLSHNPDAAEMIAAGQRVDAMFSGHTHGGQIALPFIGAPVSPSRYGNKYLGGLCEGPYCRVVVSRGVGLAGIPLRFGVPPEFGIITLHRA